MTTEHFVYWLQGFFELTDSKNLTEKQVKIIKDHLQLVFHKSTTNYVNTQLLSDINNNLTFGNTNLTCSFVDTTNINERNNLSSLNSTQPIKIKGFLG